MGLYQCSACDKIINSDGKRTGDRATVRQHYDMSSDHPIPDDTNLEKVVSEILSNPVSGGQPQGSTPRDGGPSGPTGTENATTNPATSVLTGMPVRADGGLPECPDCEEDTEQVTEGHELTVYERGEGPTQIRTDGTEGQCKECALLVDGNTVYQI